MRRAPKSVRVFALLGFGVLCAVLLFVKLRYLGWRHGPEGRAGEYEVVFYQTMKSWNPLVFRVKDARAGYYRVFDKRGRKVFELFTDSHAFDIVLTGEEGVEFQLKYRTEIWHAPVH